jgi:short-subunit dehydrogenase
MSTQLKQPQEIISGGLAVVTGASAGLGRELAVALCKRGVRVAGLARSGEGLAETAGLIEGDRFIAKVVDVGHDDAVKAAFLELRRDVGDITILVNNAAVYPRVDILDETPASFMRSVQINLGGVVSCTAAALETMAETGVGRIINVSTFADLAPIPCSSAYSVSKGAARIFSKALVADLADRFPDIVISTWIPGALNTTMGIPDGLDAAVAAQWGADLALWHDRSLNGVTFAGDREMLEHRSLKRRVKDTVLLRKPPVPRQVGLSRARA